MCVCVSESVPTCHALGNSKLERLNELSSPSQGQNQERPVFGAKPKGVEKRKKKSGKVF